MIEPIKLQLLFNENTEKDQQKFFFNHVWRKSFNDIKKALIYAILFLSLGFFPIKGFIGSPFPYIFKYAGFLYIGYAFILVYQYFTAKRKAFRLIDENINDLKKRDLNMHYIILNQNSIVIQNPLNTLSSVWEKTNYKFVDQYLILSTLNNTLHFIFNSSQFKNDDYQTLIDCLQKNSKQQN
ncbi:hypothetical protein [Chryseobacterium sp. OSA05B]|uniref:hypothetical protein n=1 Tax=Chryseobacterium sp. OSA05B TaxID=2862650 RepID=UPI001CBDFEA3|nr:hypothetical protein [Chryseobacterium sp. OSA05B]